MTQVAILLTVVLVLLCCLRIAQTARQDIFGPLVFWYAFLLLLLYSRVLTILTVDLQYRWIGNASPTDISYAILELLALSCLATAALEFGIYRGSRRRQPEEICLSFSLPMSFIPLVIGVAGFTIYFYLLGGVSNVLSNLSISKSVPGGGIILMLGSAIWLAPVMVFSNRGETDSKSRLVLSGLLFLFALTVVAIYGRATPIIWGVLLYLLSIQYCGSRLRVGRLILIAGAVVIAFISFKAYRLSISWDRDLSTLFEYMVLYRDVMLSDGGEQAMTDMSIRLLMLGDSDFPLGSFWDRWILWPIELLPSVLFPFEIEPVTVGRQMYWWATNRYDLDAGVPVFGFVSAYKTGSAGLVMLVYAGLGFLVCRLHARIASQNVSDIVAYLMALCLLLFFSRLGDFSAALVQVVVLGGIPWLLLKGLDAFFRDLRLERGRST